jgi:hypothetical protein
MLPNDGEFQPATVIGRTLGPKGMPEGKYNVVLKLNTMSLIVKEIIKVIICSNLVRGRTITLPWCHRIGVSEEWSVGLRFLVLWCNVGGWLFKPIDFSAMWKLRCLEWV